MRYRCDVKALYKRRVGGEQLRETFLFENAFEECQV
jgi:hypothetical protein